MHTSLFLSPLLISDPSHARGMAAIICQKMRSPPHLTPKCFQSFLCSPRCLWLPEVKVMRRGDKPSSAPRRFGRFEICLESMRPRAGLFNSEWGPPVSSLRHNCRRKSRRITGLTSISLPLSLLDLSARTIHFGWRKGEREGLEGLQFDSYAQREPFFK